MLGWLLAVPISVVLAQQGYSSVGERFGVSIYRRDQSSAIELAAVGDFDAAPARVHQLLLDVGRHPGWVKNLAESRVLLRKTSSIVVYQRLDLPILSDRDFTLQLTWGKTGQALWVRFHVANQLGPPPKSGIVRLTTHEGSWELEPIRNGAATRAFYRVRIDIAGPVPQWLARSRTAKDIAGHFEAMRAQLR
ncbi:MAG: hypothetical protein IT371_19990 [Deltaproteobacteria bacterium]|nr:hypothetical protein [Deltaproteobacteria bacterium]